MNGAACVAMLVGANAPLHLEGQRHTHMVHAWDFYKPVGWPSMGPIVDGPASMELYYDCLVACQAGLIERGESAWVDSHDHLVFHLGSSPKFVRHAFERALTAARGAEAAVVKAVVKEAVEAMASRVVVGAAAAADDAAPGAPAVVAGDPAAAVAARAVDDTAAGAPAAAAGDAGERASVEEEAEAAEVEALFSKLVGPSLVLAARIGPCHTAATYVNLASLLLHDPPKLGASIGIFSYGSGAASSIFKLRVRGEARVGEGLLESLDAREVHNGGDFSALTKRFADTYGRFGWEPRVRGAPSVGAYRLEECDALGRRSYKYLEVALAERYSEAELRSHREGLAAAARDKVARAAEAARAQAAQQQQQAGATDTNALAAALLSLLTANQAAAGQAA
jgi:3-hydroxy-3-methylglutaryl CoA synthase